MMIGGVVEHENHALTARAMSQKLFEKSFEGERIELRGGRPDELPRAQTDRAEAGNRLSGRRMHEDGVFNLGGDPHPRPGAVLLEVAFVHAPQLKIHATSEAPQFFFTAATRAGSD